MSIQWQPAADGITVSGPGWAFPVRAWIQGAAGGRLAFQARSTAADRFQLGARAGAGVRLHGDGGLALEAWVPDGEPALLLRLALAAPRPLAAFALDLALDAGDRALKNGWQSWSPAHGVNMATWAQPVPAGVDRHTSRDDPEARLLSEWFTALRAEGRPDLFLGFVTTARQFGQFAFYGGGRLTAYAQADGAPAAASEWLEIRLGPAQQSLEAFCAHAGALAGARVPAAPPPPGWCSWYYYWDAVSQADVARNLGALAGSPVGLVQVDDGWQQTTGQWQPNPRFPDGMAALAARIRAAGCEAGLWLAPFLLRADAEPAASHPDWLVRGPDGGPVIDRVQWGGAMGCLDTTHPGALAWLEQTFRLVSREWGYRYLKLDFLYGAAVPGVRHDPAATRVDAYRRGLAAVRAGAGPDAFIVACGAPLSATAGLAEACRIGPDVMPWWEAPWGGGVLPAARNTLVRSAMHRRLWLNDPDCLLLRTHQTSLGRRQVELWATAVALSGGLVLASDPWHHLPQERRDLFCRLLTPGPGAAPPDLLAGDIPTLFALPGGQVVGVFNWADQPAEFSVPLPHPDCHAYDAWDRLYLGRRTGSAMAVTVPGRAACLLVLRPGGPAPAVLYSDFGPGAPPEVAPAGAGPSPGAPDGGAAWTLAVAHPVLKSGELVLAPPAGCRLAAATAAGAALEWATDADGLAHLHLSGLAGRATVTLRWR